MLVARTLDAGRGGFGMCTTCAPNFRTATTDLGDNMRLDVRIEGGKIRRASEPRRETAWRSASSRGSTEDDLHETS